MPDYELIPYSHEQQPKIEIDTSNPAQLEVLAWTDTEGCIVIEEELPGPIGSLKVCLDGSSNPNGGEVKIRAEVDLRAEDYRVRDEDVVSFLAEFARTHKGTTYGEDWEEYIVHDEEDNKYLVGVDTNSRRFNISAAGGQKLDTNFEPTLRHGRDVFSDSFDAFTDFLTDFLSRVYESYDERTIDLQLTARHISYESPQPEVEQEAVFIEQAPISLEDIGGLVEQKKEIEQLIFAMRHPEVLSQWGVQRQQGLLLYGPPGTGKTSLIEAVANTLGAELEIIKSTDIYDMWLGRSEQRMEAIIERALGATEPKVFLFDEIEGIISSDKHSTHQRVAALFKQGTTQIAKENPNVLIAATTNKNDEIDPAILRAGRFDVKLYIPKPNQEERERIIGLIVARYFSRANRTAFDVMDLQYGKLAEITDDMTGADLDTICKGLLASKAFAEMRTGIIPGPVTQNEFQSAVWAYRKQKD